MHPQVYALAVLPQLLPQLHTWSEISGKMLGGADLFLQGVLVPQVGWAAWLAPAVVGCAGAAALMLAGQTVPSPIGKHHGSSCALLLEKVLFQLPCRAGFQTSWRAARAACACRATPSPLLVSLPSLCLFCPGSHM